MICPSDSHDTLHSAAAGYLAAGLCALPAIRAEKRPAVGQWKRYRKRLPTEAELSAWFANGPDAVCIICGAISGHAEMIDFDAGGELFDAWARRIPADLLARLVVETTQRGGRHVFYCCEAPVCGNMKLAQRREGDKTVTLIETRGEGGLFLCAPTAGYEAIQGDLRTPPVLTEADRDALLAAAWELNEYLPPLVGETRPCGQRDAKESPVAASGEHPGADNSDTGAFSAENSDNGRSRPHNSENGPTPASSVAQGAFPPEISHRPGDDFNDRGDVRDVLAQHGWALAKPGENEYWRRPGKTSGWSASLKDRVFYVFSANAAPFEPSRAYSPFAVYALLNHGGDYETAARSLRMSGYGGDGPSDIRTGVDLSGILGQSGVCGADDSHNAARAPEIPDPGPMPDHLLRIPGFVGEVMDYCLATAPYPNPVMAFAGALSLLAFLTGRKVRDPGDNRTNIYLLGLAHSAAGKDWPRKVNTRIVHEVGLAKCLGERFASGEGIQDALFQTPGMLFQTDEIDGMLQSINKAKDARHEAIMSTLLTMYSASNSVFPMRRKAGKEAPGVINQPSLVIFGTAIPNHYYEALSERMLTNGFFARMIILEAGPRGTGQEPVIRDLPPSVLAAAKWWADYRPGTGNLENWNPVPTVIDHTDEARRLLIETREQAEAEYSAAEAKGDSVGTTVWGRVSEQTRKLALLYAVSENHLAPRIGLAAVQWASAFVMHQTRRMLFMAASHVADSEFDALCLRAIEKIRNAPGAEIGHSVLLKRLKIPKKEFADLMDTLACRGDVEVKDVTTSGRTGRWYALPGAGEGRCPGVKEVGSADGLSG